MNNKRRQQLRKLIEKMEVLKDELEVIASDEQEYFDTMPENLQGSTNGMNSEEAIDKMADAIVCVEEAIEAIEEII
jgi:hypothetical protein